MPPWDKYGSAASPQGIPIGPQDPAAPYRGLDAATEIQARQSNMQNDAARLDLARQANVLSQQNANKPPPGYRWANGGMEPIPGGPADPRTLQAATKPALTAKERADAIAGYQSGAQLDRIVQQLEAQYKAGPGSTSGISGLTDYLPLTQNQQFDRTGNAARGIVGSAMGFTGGQLNTATEAEAAVGPYLPQSADRDEVIRDKIERLRQLSGDARSRSTAILGGVPDANGQVTPVGNKTPWQQTYLASGGAPQAAAAGSTSQAAPIPPEMQREYSAWISQNAQNIDPDAYVHFRAALDQKYGYGRTPERDEEDRKWAITAGAAGRGGGTIQTQIPPPEVPLSGLDKLRNDAVSNPFGAAAAGALDAGGFGGVSALAGDQMKALGNSNPLAMGAGQIVGSIAGTSALGRLGRETIGRGAPSLLGGAGRAQLGRDLATDAGYSAAYGTNTGNDPFASAALGVGGSVVGRGVGRGLGAAVGGVTASPAVQALRQRGIPLTVGQTLGGIPKRMEDRMTSIPGVGEMVNARRLEGLRAFNLQAMNEAAAPIGGAVRKVGEEGVSDLTKQISQSYDDATRGVNVPLDPQFRVDMRRAAMARDMLPDDYAGKFDKVGQNRIGPIVNAGELTGETYQQSMRGLRGSRASASGAAPGFEDEYRSALSQVMDALKGQMTRGGGDSVVQGLGKSDEAYRMSKTLADAVKRARNGSRSGEVQTFAPSQLVDAGTAAAAKYPGPRPFADLADIAQRVLPSSIPDSGTAGRVMTAALPAALGGAAGGVGYAADGQEGLYKGLALAALLAGGGTKGGQKAINAVLTGRPDIARRAGRLIGKKKGLFGSATIPLGLEFGE